MCVLEDDHFQMKELPCVGQEVDVNTSQTASNKMIRSGNLTLFFLLIYSVLQNESIFYYSITNTQKSSFH